MKGLDGDIDDHLTILFLVKDSQQLIGEVMTILVAKRALKRQGMLVRSFPSTSGPASVMARVTITRLSEIKRDGCANISRGCGNPSSQNQRASQGPVSTFT